MGETRVNLSPCSHRAYLPGGEANFYQICHEQYTHPMGMSVIQRSQTGCCDSEVRLHGQEKLLSGDMKEKIFRMRRNQ